MNQGTKQIIGKTMVALFIALTAVLGISPSIARASDAGIAAPCSFTERVLYQYKTIQDSYMNVTSYDFTYKNITYQSTFEKSGPYQIDSYYGWGDGKYGLIRVYQYDYICH